jgi:alkanesulfonate monooxygenase SsuD/methylene tetrahydromethanopterin reductase-like flavin-dependent oxidoreductase (luciferase family)
MDESMEIISRAWADGSFSFEGRHFSISDIDVTPKPVQRPRPPIWMAARSEAPLRRAAKYADGVIAVGSPDLIGRYRQFVAEAGNDPNEATVAVLRSTIISDDPERTWADVEKYVTWRGERYGQWYGEAADLPQDVARLEQLRSGETPPGAGREALIRSVDQEAAALARLRENGVDCVIYFATFPGMPPLEMLPTFEAMVKDIFPALR